MWFQDSVQDSCRFLQPLTWFRIVSDPSHSLDNKIRNCGKIWTVLSRLMNCYSWNLEGLTGKHKSPKAQTINWSIVQQSNSSMIIVQYWNIKCGKQSWRSIHSWKFCAQLHPGLFSSQPFPLVLPEPFSVDTIPFSCAVSLPYSPHNQPHALIHVYITPFCSHRMSSVNHAQQNTVVCVRTILPII